ncbi:unnamed protein product [Ranitomeya imitator]|uniref:Class II aldolase/adducin N-terminal domain-containing protein n=1 Tax=Ranitomeya imitator TaxID=111125 RepID=A0ABN9L446_9NEOB|nr:unnamed protein product [Ranitomeya imitator]
MILFALAAAAWHWLLQDIVPVYQIKGISKLVKLCLPKVQCFCDSLTSPPSERQFNALLMSVASLLANDSSAVETEMSTQTTPEAVTSPPAEGPRYFERYSENDPEYLRIRNMAADLRQDFNVMEQKKRVTMILQSPENERFAGNGRRINMEKLDEFRLKDEDENMEELESLIQEQMKKGNNSSNIWALRQIADFMASTAPSVFPTCPVNSSMVAPINDLHCNDPVPLAKGERLMRCKLASIYRLIDLNGWAQLSGTFASIRVNKEQDHFLISPRGVACNEVSASTLVKVNILGEMVEVGSSIFEVDTSDFSLHSAIYSARPDVSAMKCGLLPISHDALLAGEVVYYDFNGDMEEEKDRIELQKSLGPTCKISRRCYLKEEKKRLDYTHPGVVLLRWMSQVRNSAFYLHSMTSSSGLHAVAPAQAYFVCPVEGRAKYCSAQAPERADKVRLRQSRSVKIRRGRHGMKIGGAGADLRHPFDRTTAGPPLGYIGGLSTALQNAVDKLLMMVSAVPSAGGPENLILLDREKYRPHEVGTVGWAGSMFGPMQKSRLGEYEFEALMRMMDNLGYRTGYTYRHPFVQEKTRHKSDVEIPATVTAFVFEEEGVPLSTLRQHAQKQQKEKTRWLNTPNTYLRVNVAEENVSSQKSKTTNITAAVTGALQEEIEASKGQQFCGAAS